MGKQSKIKNKQTKQSKRKNKEQYGQGLPYTDGTTSIQWDTERVNQLQKAVPHLFLSNRDIGAHFRLDHWSRHVDVGGLNTFDGIEDVVERIVDWNGRDVEIRDQKYAFRQRDYGGKDFKWTTRFSTIITKKFVQHDHYGVDAEEYDPCCDDENGCRFCNDEMQPLIGLKGEELEKRLQNLPLSCFLSNKDIGKLFHFCESFNFCERSACEARFDGIDEDSNFIFWAADPEYDDEYAQHGGVFKLTLKKLVFRAPIEIDPEDYEYETDSDEDFNFYTDHIVPQFENVPFQTKIGRARQLWGLLLKLIPLFQFQRRFKERFYMPGGAFVKIAGVRFKLAHNGCDENR